MTKMKKKTQNQGEGERLLFWTKQLLQLKATISLKPIRNKWDKRPNRSRSNSKTASRIHNKLITTQVNNHSNRYLPCSSKKPPPNHRTPSSNHPNHKNSPLLPPSNPAKNANWSRSNHSHHPSHRRNPPYHHSNSPSTWNFQPRLWSRIMCTREDRWSLTSLRTIMCQSNTKIY